MACKGFLKQKMMLEKTDSIDVLMCNYNNKNSVLKALSLLWQRVLQLANW